MKKFLFSLVFFTVMMGLLLGSILQNSDKDLISPLLKQQKVLGINLWLPDVGLDDQIDAPKISAAAALFLETKTGQVLYSKNPNQRLPVASLVKVMTVLIALEHKEMEDKYWVPQEAADMEPDKMLLISGETLTLKELLYGIFLVSANDAAEVLAIETTGKREEFLNFMNEKAKQLGMKDSYFVNPTGLDEDLGNSYSSAYDLTLLTRYLIRNYPEVVDISKTDHILIPQTATHQDYEMYSGINLLTTYEGVVGFKTGYTPEAGYTLITLARRDGHEVIGVLLDSYYRRDEAKELLDYSFKKLGV